VKLIFKESFAKDLDNISDHKAIAQIERVIQSTITAHSLQEIPNIKKLHASGSYFRIRVGQYRIGVIVEGSEIIFVRCLHRRDVYRYFP
jgi:mRNA interferase RelE/StbE